MFESSRASSPHEAASLLFSSRHSCHRLLPHLPVPFLRTSAHPRHSSLSQCSIIDFQHLLPPRSCCTWHKSLSHLQASALEGAALVIPCSHCASLSIFPSFVCILIFPISCCAVLPFCSHIAIFIFLSGQGVILQLVSLCSQLCVSCVAFLVR